MTFEDLNRTINRSIRSIQPLIISDLPDMFSIALEKINGMDLSIREIDVIACTLSGRSGKETAIQLSIAHSTVEAHINNIKDVLNCNGRSNIINFIEKSGKYSLYRQHYINLLIHPVFEAILKKFGNLLKSTVQNDGENAIPRIYIGLLNPGQELYLKFAKKLIEDLNLIGIQTKIKAFNFNHFQEGNKNNQVSGLLKIKEKDRSQMILLGKVPTSLNLNEGLSNFQLLTNERTKNYYGLFFEILTKIPNFPSEILNQIISEFENERLMLDSSSSNAISNASTNTSSSTDLDSESNSDTNTNFNLNTYPNFYSQINIHPESEKKAFENKVFENKASENNLWNNLICLIKRRKKLSSVLSLVCLCSLVTLSVWFVNLKNATQAIRWNLPRQDHLFVGRVKSLKILDEQMDIKKQRDFDSGNQPASALAISACAGLGGIGKTQLALHYAHHTRHPYTLIAWFPAENLDELQQKIIAFSQWLGYSGEKPSISEALSFVNDWLEKNPGWLLIFDNVNQYDEIKSYLPERGGNIILTSRYRNWPSKFNILDLDVMDEEDSVLLLKSLIKQDFAKNTEKNNRNVSGKKAEKRTDAKTDENFDLKLKRIAKQLGYLPLAMAHAGAYIQQNHCSIDDYLNLYSASEQDCLTHQTMPEGTNGLSVASTWNINLEAIAKETKAQKQPLYSLELLLVCAYLAPDKISKDLLLSWLKERHPNLHHPEFVLSEALGQLWKYSLINLDGENNISIHRLVQSTLQQQYFKKNNINTISLPFLDEAMYKTMLIAIHKEFNRFSQSTGDKESRQNLLPHLQSLIQHCDTLWPKSAFLKASLSDVIYDLGVLFNHLLQAKPSIIYFDRSIKMKEEFFGKDHGETLSPLLRLGMAYRTLGDDLKSKAILEKVLTLRKHHRSDNDLELALILSALGITYKNLGMYEASLSAHEKALTIQEQYDGKNSLEIAKTLICLSNTLGYLGKPKEQKASASRAIKIFENHQDNNYAHIAKAQANIGYAEIALGNLEQAKIFLEKSLKLRQQFFGERHYWVAYTLSYLGHVYCELGEYDQAKTLLNKALDIKKEYHGTEHYEVAKTLVYLGILHKYLGDHQQAKNELEQALAINEKHYGKEHFEVAKTLVELGEVYHALGNSEALPVLQRALKMQSSFYGDNHLETSYTLSNLGYVYLKLNNLKLAKEMLEKALTTQKSQLDNTTPKMNKTEQYLSELYNKIGIYEKLNTHSMRSDGFDQF